MGNTVFLKLSRTPPDLGRTPPHSGCCRGFRAVVFFTFSGKFPQRGQKYLPFYSRSLQRLALDDREFTKLSEPSFSSLIMLYVAKALALTDVREAQIEVSNIWIFLQAV